MQNLVTVGLAQIAPIWLKRSETLDKVIGYVEDAAAQDCHLVVFGEALAPGYPFWLELTDGARFNAPGVRHRNDSSESMFAKC